MAGTYSELKQAIDKKIYTNGSQAITGAVLNEILKLMVDELGENSTFAGIATPATVPGDFDGDVFYIAATPGTYANFGADLTLSPASIGIIRNSSGSWEMTSLAMVGVRTSDGGEVFNDYSDNTAGYRSRSSGHNNKVSGKYSSADGANNTVSSDYANAEGVGNTASGNASSTEGSNNITTGQSAHTEGASNKNNAAAGHVEGYKNTAQNDSEHAEGRYNISHTGESAAEKTRHSIGIGTNEERKNAVEVMENGDMYVIGAGGYDGTNPGTGKTIQAILTELDNTLGDISTILDNINGEVA